MAIYSKLAMIALTSFLLTAKTTLAVWSGPGLYSITSSCPTSPWLVALNVTAQCQDLLNTTSITSSSPLAPSAGVWEIAQITSPTTGNASYAIISNPCGTFLNFATPNGTAIAVQASPTSPGGLWNVDNTTAGGGKVIFRNVGNPGFVLDLQGDCGTTVGSLILVFKDHSSNMGANQQWLLNPLT